MITILESPYNGEPEACRYLACALLDSLLRGEAPIASHAIYPLALYEKVRKLAALVRETPHDTTMLASANSDTITDRELGLSAMREIKRAIWTSAVPSQLVMYTDIGVSQGMQGAYDEWKGQKFRRGLTREAYQIYHSGGWPSPARLTPNHHIDMATPNRKSLYKR